MESNQTNGLVRSIQINVAQDGQRLAMGQKAACRRLDKSASAILDGLLGRKATKEEVQASTTW